MRTALILCAVFFLAGCSHPAPPMPPDPSFTRFQPIYLSVAKIEIVDEYKSPMRSPNIEHLLPYSPADAMHIWVNDRLRAVGSEKFLQVIIKDGSVIVSALPKPEGVTHYFSLGKDKQYDAKLEVEMRIYGGAAMSEANVRAAASRSVTINESASLAEREATFRSMINAMMEQMNAELEKNMFMYFGNYISYSHTP